MVGGSTGWVTVGGASPAVSYARAREAVCRTVCVCVCANVRGL